MGMFSKDDDYPASSGVSEDREKEMRARLEICGRNSSESLEKIRLQVLASNQVQEPNIG